MRFKLVDKLSEDLLVEDSQLYKGIFWVPDIDNPDKNYYFKIDCDSDGSPQRSEYELNAKSGDTYNHKLLWSRLPKEFTKNNYYNYYPRGRVEIKNSVARIFLNGNIATEDIIDFLINEFNLNRFNNIKNVKIIIDNSQHYLCHLDSGWKAD